jgi:hypothetical protein
MDASVPPSAKAAAPRPTPPARENLWANLGCNIVIPSLLMTKGPHCFGLAPLSALVIALAFPFAYGVYDLWKRRIWNLFSIIGLGALLITGGIGLLQLQPKWVAVKDGAVPLVLGLIVVGSLATRRPLVQALLLNPTVIDVERVETALSARGGQAAFRALLRRATALVAASFLLHSALNYALARYLVKSPPGTPEFTAEIGRMTLLSWPMIILPSGVIMAVAMFYLLHGLKKLTGLELEDMFHEEAINPPKKQ